jgi:hypothetical protein
MKQGIAFFIISLVFTAFISACNSQSSSPIFFTPPPDASSMGIQYELQSDSSIRIIDNTNGYGLILSKNWLPVLNNHQTIKESADSLARIDPQLAELLTSRSNLNTQYRVLIFNTDDTYRDETMVTHISVYVASLFPSNMSLNAIVKQMAGGAPSQGVAENKNSIEYGYMNGEVTGEFSEKPVKLYKTLLLIKIDNGEVYIDLSMPISLAKNSQDLLQEVIDSVYLIDK